MQDKPKTLTPKLRFSEFRDGPGWGIRPLGEQGELLSSLSGKTAQHFGVGSARYITYMNVFSNTFTDMSALGTVDVGADESQNTVERGDILFTVSSETPEEVGMSSVVLETVLNCYLNSFCALFRFNGHERPDLRFLGYSLRQPLAREHFSHRAQGSTRFNLSKAAFRDLPLPLPSPAEQQKIAACLTSLDDWIAADGRKLEALRAHKKGLMQQLFPREGETRPRLRFPEFRYKPKWESTRILNLLERVALPIEVEPGKTYREIGVRSHGKGIFHKDQLTGSAIGTKRVFRVVEDALVLNIIFAWEQAVAFTTKAEAGMIASHRFPMFLPKENACDVRFVKLAFLTPAGKHLLGLASPGGAGRNRTLGQVEFDKVEIHVLEQDDHTLTADVVVAAQALIDAQSRKLDGLRAHKKGLMQQLFPSAEDAK